MGAQEGWCVRVIMAAKKKAGKGTKKRRKAKAKKVSSRVARLRLWSGKAAKSKGGLAKWAFTKNKGGKIVSKSRSAGAKKRLGKWVAAMLKARKELKLKGFVACKKGSAFYKAARKNYGK